MERNEWTTVDKSGWPAGPWEHEPDIIQWADETTGLPCVIIRHRQRGHLCGYVGTRPGHVLYGQPADKTTLLSHGGPAEYAGPSLPNLEEAPAGVPAAREDTWWFGFDCSHARDVAPGDRAPFLEGAEYREVDYVVVICVIMALQIAAAQSHHDELVAQAAFVCPRCGKPSSSADDAANGYCGQCRDFTGHPAEVPPCPGE